MTSLLRQSTESNITATNEWQRPTAPHQFLIHQLIPHRRNATTSDATTRDMITAVYAISAETILAFQSTIDFWSIFSQNP